MGWFDDEIKVVVASTMLNLAGDIDGRFNYLKSSVIKSVLSPGDRSIADDVFAFHWNGPAMAYRSFFRWSESNYDLGKLKTSLQIPKEIKDSDIIPHLGLAQGKSAFIQDIDIGPYNVNYWAWDYMAKNHPSNLYTNWTAGPSEANTRDIEIVLENGSTITFTPPTVDPTASFIYVRYTETSDIIYEEVIEHEEQTSDYRPEMEGYHLVSSVILSSIPTVLTGKITTVISYSDGRPSQTTTEDLPSRPVQITNRREHWEKTVFEGDDENTVYEMRMVRTDRVGNQISVIITSEVVNGVIVTTTRTKEEEVIDPEWTYKLSSQKFYSVSETNPKTFIYQIGSGNTYLDSLVTRIERSDKFFPFIPVKFLNEYINESQLVGGYYEPAKKAFKKALKTDIDKLIEDLKETPDQDKMSFVYTVFGVSLNVKDNSSRKYIIEFLKFLEETQQYNATNYKQWSLALKKAKEQDQIYEDWLIAQRDPNNPKYGKPAPPKGQRVNSPGTIVHINNNNPNILFSMVYPFRYIQTTRHIGLGKPDAKTGEVWSDVKLNDFTYKFDQKPENTFRKALDDVIHFYHQTSATTYEKIKVVGLMQMVNMDFNIKNFVTVPARMALADPEESGFLVPLNYDIFRRMSLKDSTQMSTACTNILINSYIQYRIPWYTKVLKYALIIGSIVLSIFTAGAGLAFAGGILGTNIAVGTMLGLSGTMAAIVGAVANTIAAIVLTTVISEVSTMLFGDEIGMIVGMVVGLVALSIGSSLAMTGSFSLDISNLFTAENLLKITDSVSQSYQQFLKGDTINLQNQMNDMNQAYQDQIKQIQDLTKQFLAGTGIFVGLETLLGNDLYIAEDRETFIRRTLLTGSDIANMSNNMISNFTTLTINNELK